MKTNDDILDRNILAPFEKTFRAMGIGDYQIATAIQDFSLPPLDFDTREKLSTDGLIAAENFADEWIELAEPQLYFKYKKRVVIMYQRDQLLTQENYAQRRYRPYHLCFCNALREAHEKNRYEGRYVMTYNTSGKFKVNLSVRDKNSDGTVYTQKKEQDIFLPLRVCQHCLREINWKHFRSYCGGGLEWWRGGNSYMRRKIVDEFNLEEYLVTARQDNFFDHPVFGTASSTISNEYVLSPEIKEALKKIVDYTCDICREQFPDNELQIHHKNHLPGDNRRQNLMVVCENCHKLIHNVEGGFVSTKKNSSTSSASKRTFSSAEYAAAQKNLGDMYANGWGVPKDEFKAQVFYGKAFKAYQNLAAEEDVDAWYELANFYMLGAGVEKNIYEAQWRFKSVFTLYKARADSGDIKAKIRLGLMYAKGFGVQQDLYSAKEIIASVRKNITFINSEFIELCLLAGNFDDALKFHAKAIHLFEVAAKNGDKDATFEIAKLYSNRDFVSPDYDIKASELFKAFAEFYIAWSAEYEPEIKRQKEIEPQREVEIYVQKARKGDVPSILELKRLAKNGNVNAKVALEPLYYDGKRIHAVGTIVLPEGLTSIGELAFWGCSSLKEIVLPEGLTSIGERAFYYCSSLKEIVLPEGLISIGERAFWGCSSLEKIVLPEGLTSIGEWAFVDCSSLKNIAYYKKTESILRECFVEYWDSLKKTVIND